MIYYVEFFKRSAELPQCQTVDWQCHFAVCGVWYFFFNRHCNPCGFWPAQLSLNILSGKGFTECRCQRHVKPPNLEDQWLERSNSRHQVSPTPETTQANPSSGRWNYGREIYENFAEGGDFHVTFGFFYMGPTGLFPLRRKARWGFFRPSFGRVWTRKLGYQRPARLPLDHRSRWCVILTE